MKKLSLLLAALALALSGALLPASPATSAPAASPAAAPTAAPSAAPAARAGVTKCLKGSGSYSGRCFTMLSSRTKSVVVEAVPLKNKTKRKRANMHCSFTTTITRTFEAGASVTASVEAGLFGTVKASVSTTLHMKVSQTAAQATTAGSDITLGPGEHVICQRTYGSVIARVKDYTYRGKDSTTVIRKVRIPSVLGVTVTD